MHLLLLSLLFLLLSCLGSWTHWQVQLIRLQGRGVDMTEAYDDASSVIKDIKNTRKNICKEFCATFEQDKRVDANVRTQPSMHRTAKKNKSTETILKLIVLKHYRRVFAILFIDELISELELRFTKLSHSASRILFLIPTVITKVPLDKDAYQQITEMYGKDRPNQDLVGIEVSSWKRKWIEWDEKLRPKTIASSLKKCSKDVYPNLSVLLKLAATLLVTSCKCERSFTVLRRLRNWLRGSMTTKRL